MQAGGADQTGDGKKKYNSVVYKRRIAMPLAQAEQFLAEETAEQKGRYAGFHQTAGNHSGRK